MVERLGRGVESDEGMGKVWLGVLWNGAGTHGGVDAPRAGSRMAGQHGGQRVVMEGTSFGAAALR